MMLSHSWPGPSTVALLRGGHVRSPLIQWDQCPLLWLWAVQNPQEHDSFTAWLASASGASMPSTYVLVHSWGCWVRATLQHSLASKSQETCCQHCTSLNKGEKLVPERSSGADKRSHEHGKILRQSAPSVTALAITVLCHYSESRLLLRAPALGSSKYICPLLSGIKVYLQSLSDEESPLVLLTRYRFQFCHDSSHSLYAVPTNQIIWNYMIALWLKIHWDFEHNTLGKPWSWVSKSWDDSPFFNH